MTSRTAQATSTHETGGTPNHRPRRHSSAKHDVPNLSTEGKNDAGNYRLAAMITGTGLPKLYNRSLRSPS